MSTVSDSSVRVDSDHDYAALEKLIAQRVASLSGPLFTTNATGLFEAYLEGILERERQHYTCRCCWRFIENYGGLVSIAADGTLRTEMCGMLGVPDFFRESLSDMQIKVLKAKVTGVFINGDKEWGVASNVAGLGSKYVGQTWTHLHGTPATVFSSPLKTAEQVMAEKLQDYITLRKGLEDYSLDAAVQGVRVLEADAVDRSEKTLGVAQWLLKLHQTIEGKRGAVRDNLIWLAVAGAPPGWCHIRSTMISTLLDDVVQGLPFDAIKRRWNEKMHPLQYQRPTTVKEGNIEQANKIVAKLQSEGALQRRFARLEDIVPLWTPKPLQPAPTKRQGGAFDHLKAKGGTVKAVELPAKRMSWHEFQASVLPTASEIEVDVPYSGEFFGMVTAVNPDAAPILQWDGLPGCARNPVSHYFYVNGSTAAQWGLAPGRVKVNAICLKPPFWQQPEKFAHQGKGVFFVLDGARDTRHEQGGCFFPESLRTEYHKIRSAMEAYAQSAKIEGRDEGTANGIALDERQSLAVRVKSAGGVQDYALTL